MRIRSAGPSDGPVLHAIAFAAYARYLPRMSTPPAPLSADYAAIARRGQAWLATVSRPASPGGADSLASVARPATVGLPDTASAPAAVGLPDTVPAPAAVGLPDTVPAPATAAPPHTAAAPADGVSFPPATAAPPHTPPAATAAPPDHASSTAADASFRPGVADEVTGFIVLVPAPGYLLLENIAVLPSAQGIGVGAALLEFAEQHARSLGVPEIRLYTNAAMTENLAWYPRHGYRETGRGEQDGFSRVFFAKPVRLPD